MSDHTPDVPQKQCPWCDKLLPVTGEFWATDKARPDGLCHACKACQLKRRRELKATAAERKARKESGLKTCPRCERELPATLEYFYQEKRRKSFCLKSYCKQCEAKISRETRDKTKESERAYKYFLAHKQEQYDRRRKWRERNLDAVRAYEAKQKRDDPNRDKRNKAWRAKNPEKYRKQRVAYRHKAADKLRLIMQRYVARKAGLPNDFTEQDWQFALDYFGGCCAVCGRPILGLFHSASADHWIPLSSPDCPGTIPVNMVPLCFQIDGCNNSKHNRDPNEWLIWKFGEKQAKVILVKVQEFFTKVRQV